MRILFITAHYPPDRVASGVATYTKATAVELARLGADVHVLVIGDTSPGSEYTDDDVTVHRRRGYWRRPLRWLFRAFGLSLTGNRLRFAIVARRHARLLKPDIVEYSSERAAGLLIRREDAQVRYTYVHGPWRTHDQLNRVRPSMDRTLVYWLDYKSVQRADQVIAPSPFTKELMRAARWSIDSFVSIPPVIPSAIEGDLLAADTTGPVVLFIGRCDYHKGFDFLMEAVSYLPPVPELEIRIVGNGELLDWALRDRESSEAPRVVALGRLSNAATIEQVAESRVLVVPSRLDNFPVVALEGMAAGRPLVISGQTGLSEVVRSNSCGIVIDDLNARSLAEGLAVYLDDPARAGRDGAAGSVVSSTLLDGSRSAVERLAMYESALEPKAT